jgi:hypothetical protein
MEPQSKGNGPDASSIKPVSSLLSKFENLQKEPDAPRTPISGQRQFSLGNRVVSGERPQSAGRLSASPPANRPSNVAPIAIPRARRLSPPRQRPVSMAAGTPPQIFPPLVTVDSPKSPPVDFARESRLANTIRTASPATGSPSGSRVHSRNLSRSTTPALEQRMSAFLVDSDFIKPSFTGNGNGASVSNTQATAPKLNGPPPVNRAGKPKIPVKPASLAQPSQGLTAPEPNPTELTDHSASPFSTPPSSAASSPAKTPSGHARARSDASFVERLRADSDTSSFADRVRSGSTTSSIEPFSLNESHFEPPPLHHNVAPRRDNRNGLSRATTIPARYSPRFNRDMSPSGDLQSDRPRLPVRPELQMRSGRTSPPKAQSGASSPSRLRSGRTSPSKLSQITTRRSVDLPHRSNTFHEQPQPRIPAVKPAQSNALAAGFDRTNTPPIAAQKALAPEVPPPRRSMDKRPQAAPVVQTVGHSHDDIEELPLFPSAPGQGSTPNDFPDSSTASRRPPRYRKRPHHISTEYDTRLVAACGEYVCTTGFITKVWNVRTGERVLHMAHSENMKVTSLVFKPTATVEEEGTQIWLGTSSGEIHEIDIINQQLLKTKSAHRREVIKLFRYASELWSLDESGELVIWKKSSSGMPSLDQQTNSFRVPKGHTFSIACGEQLWIATGKDIRVFRPSAKSDEEFQVLRNPLNQPNTGDVTSGATISSHSDFVYFGHTDGKVSIYNRRDFSCTGVINVSVYKISSLAGVGDYLWAGYNTGMAYVYDTSCTPWKVKKDWRAHEKQICSILAEPSAVWNLNRLQVITLGTDNMLRMWDGMLEEDWLDTRMHERDSDFCTFRELKVAVMTWNAGAVKPSHVHSQYMSQDNNFLRDYMVDQGSPDILVFGFQELVDLENKKVTAKSFFKSKKKDPAEQEHMSHQYRAWRDYLTRCVEDFMPADNSYVLLHTASMVGLFTCIFVKGALRSRIKHVHTSEVKRGMGGLHGNKGALVLRMVLDDSSLCFLNCHLAAGQTQTIHRNNDIAAILEAEPFPANPLSQDSSVAHTDIFTSGGDGSMIMDHEICIINGDLNYRIDTMGRDTVIKHVKENNLPRLLERDQLLLSRKKNPGFRLRAFAEAPITFAPTYKYNVNTDDYDTSEKKRAPAWCDRVLYRGLGKVKCEEYRRWEVRVSDHRPVSALFRVRVKRVENSKRGPAWEKCMGEFEVVRGRVKRSVQ